MKASETKLQPLIEGTIQYVIPLFQRPYSWEKREWSVLWDDIVELCQSETRRTHFIGSIVTMPTSSVPEGVSKYLLIDGQQRLTTIFVLLALLRDTAKTRGEVELSQEINQTLLVNHFKKGSDHLKLFPSHGDRDAFSSIIEGKPNANDSRLVEGYEFFSRKLRQHNELSPELIKQGITTLLSVVSIRLDPDDNPHLVFESLNAKGRPLSQADLIRNFFFMRIHVDQQDEMYFQYWKPMQDALGEDLTEFIRHYLMRDGAIVKESDVYFSLKELVGDGDAIEHLKHLNHFAGHYKRLLVPNNEVDGQIREALERINRIEVTTVYPFLLNVYEEYSQQRIPSTEFITILKLIENFMIRRFVCNIPTRGLNKIFPLLFSQARAASPSGLPEGVRQVLQRRDYPSDTDFRSRLLDTKLYGAGDRLTKTKLISESIEMSFGHKEQVPFNDLTLEHIMPQTLTEKWQDDLGEDWEIAHELLLHTLGNLTLTAYNPELSNDDFETKKRRLGESHLEMNKYFKDVPRWDREEIERRATKLTDTALSIWSFFGDERQAIDRESVTSKSPRALWILGQYFEVKSWRDVMENTLNTIADLEPDKFQEVLRQFPSFVTRDKKKLRAVRELKNGIYIEVNLSARAIQRLCLQALETIGLTTEDWRVEIGQDDFYTPDDEPEVEKERAIQFQDDWVKSIETYLGQTFTKHRTSYYIDREKLTRLVGLASKQYPRSNEHEYWFGFSPKQSEFLSFSGSSYIAFACGSAQKLLLIPYSEFEPFLQNMRVTETDRIRHWHVHIFDQDGTFFLAQPLADRRVDLSQFRLTT